jgi:hypothetical protein
MEVSIEMARLFKDQCVGSYSGHMSMISNNPIMQSIFMSILPRNNHSTEEFAEILIAIGNKLKEGRAS